jgi:hypothetical protein
MNEIKPSFYKNMCKQAAYPCPRCNKDTQTIHSLKWIEKGVDASRVPSWGCPQECEGGHITIRDSRCTTQFESKD